MIRSIVTGLCALATACGTAALAAAPGVLVEEFIYEEAPFPSCHAATIVETPEALVAAWFGGTDEGEDDVGIWVSRHEKGRWSAPVEVANGVESPEKRYPCWNPALFQMPDGPLLLFYKVGPTPRSWWGMLMTSSDAGRTWSKPKRLPEGMLGPIKNKPIFYHGDLLCPSSTEHDGWKVHIERTVDGGQTWTKTPSLEDSKQFGVIQPAMLEHPDGRLQILCRSQQRKIVESWSADAGESWSPLSPTSLPNPNSGIDASTLADGRIVLVYNHTPRGRSPLNVAVSADGTNWQAALALETVPGEFSYPAVIATADGLVHVAYTWNRKRIRHAVLDPTRFEPRPIEDGRWPR